MRHHALGKQPLEWFRDIKPPDPLERARPETGVEQVEDRMFNPADILANGQPAFGLFLIERGVFGLRGEADEIPATVDKCIKRIGFAPRGFFAIGAGDMFPRRVALKRVAGNVKADIFGQDNRQ